ncbi:MAG TPA: hypothetical protein VFO62_00440 [Candidatus Binatia bacterium]|nr:hypothetical protein [Candidatus Binatia bacterium]
MNRLTDRAGVVHHVRYTATIESEELTPWGILTTWLITRDGSKVGKAFQGGGGYGESVTCSMAALRWAGACPPTWPPKLPTYGMGFDVGPHDSLNAALAAFEAGAERLIAWRERIATEKDT